MEFAYPAAFAGLAAIPLLFLLNLYRYRRLRVTVGSLIIWKRLAEHADTPPSSKQRYFNLSLLMQILFIIFLSIALAGPKIGAHVGAGRSVHVLIDRSASTEANSSGSRVFDKILLEASSLIKKLSPGDLVRCHVSPGPAGLQSAGPFAPAEAQDWLNALSPVQMEGDVAAAVLSVAAIAAHEIPGTPENAQVFLFTDSRCSAPDSVKVCIVAADPGNCALTAIAAAGDARGLHIFFRIANFSRSEKTVPWSVSGNSGRRYAESGDSPPLLKPGLDEGISALLPAEASEEKVLEVRLTEADSLLSDDAAYVFRNPAGEIAISYIGRQNPDILRALSAIPGALVTLAESPEDGCSLAVFNEVSPKAPPPCTAVVIAPPNGIPTLVKAADSDTFEPSAPLDGKGSDLATNDAWAERLTVRKALSPVILKQTLATSLLRDAGGRELIVSFTKNKLRTIYVGFGLQDTNWTDHVSFPVFWGLLAEELGGGEEWIACKTGGTVTLPARGLDNIRTPDGQMLPQPHSGIRAVFSPEATGIHRAVYADGEKLFAASLLSPAESKLENTEMSFKPSWLRPPGEMKRREKGTWLWRYFAFAAALAMLASWILWRERKKR